MKKKIIGIMSATIMVFSIGALPISAAENQARGPMCPCGGRLLPSYSYTKWVTYDSKKCTHGYAYGTDQYKKREVTTTMKCNRCGNGYVSGTTTEKKVECTGHN